MRVRPALRSRVGRANKMCVIPGEPTCETRDLEHTRRR
jgi:hypothetical protein